MRGSIYYQTSVLTKMIFREGAQKTDRINPDHEHYQCVASYKTMDSYRRVWNNFGLFLKNEFRVKDFERTTANHIEAYMMEKVSDGLSKQYLEKISSALGKLELALNRFYHNICDKPGDFDFSIRQTILDQARDDGLLCDGYHNRCYRFPEQLIANLSTKEHELAANIQLHGGARFEGTAQITKKQLKGIREDKITNQQVGVLTTKEKGGKVGDVQLPVLLYRLLETYINVHGVFKIDYQSYNKDIKQSCTFLGIHHEGTHGLRWSFARSRLREYQQNGYTYEQALQGVSWEMKHHRPSISEHYLGS